MTAAHLDIAALANIALAAVIVGWHGVDLLVLMWAWRGE